MEAWPFTEDEWQAVGDAALARLNATFAHDEALRESCLLTLREVLAELRNRHGDHPILWETEADFTDADEERVALHGRAVAAAEADGFQTLTIRISLAEALLRLSRPAEARAELLACADEREEIGDELDRRWWAEAMDECERLLVPSPPA